MIATVRKRDFIIQQPKGADLFLNREINLSNFSALSDVFSAGRQRPY